MKKKHFYFRPELKVAVSVPNPDPTESTMRVFIPINVNHNSVYVEAEFRKAYSGIYILNFKLTCNEKPGKSNIKFCCISIKNAYNNNKINMIVIKTQVIDNSSIDGRRPGNYLLHNYPNWENDPIEFELKTNLEEEKLISPNRDAKKEIPILENPNLVFDNESNDSCTIPPNSNSNGG
ncbi:hypothetical protein [Aquimarina spongiae]|uniref:Uncharacterized protein n=1 Tax=Aquimarina spongiae TaxID=570521 RepID=A0A1M6KAK9_9FLAO|nr:hypothetical protein [Aquimarina spongiae]SHJ55924.1 hypothetical protein SAMN04488508_110165 [Aquimarina spongiae]